MVGINIKMIIIEMEISTPANPLFFLKFMTSPSFNGK